MSFYTSMAICKMIKVVHLCPWHLIIEYICEVLFHSRSMFCLILYFSVFEFDTIEHDRREYHHYHHHHHGHFTKLDRKISIDFIDIIYKVGFNLSKQTSQCGSYFQVAFTKKEMSWRTYHNYICFHVFSFLVFYWQKDLKWKSNEKLST